MKRIPCPDCPHENLYYIVAITEDYILLQCPDCECEFTIVAAQDLEC